MQSKTHQGVFGTTAWPRNEADGFGVCFTCRGYVESAVVDDGSGKLLVALDLTHDAEMTMICGNQ